MTRALVPAGARRSRHDCLTALTLRVGPCLFAAFFVTALDARAQGASPPGVAMPANHATQAPRSSQPAGARSSRRNATIPQPVVAVVHRLRGWRLRALVAPPDAPIAATFDESFVRTNIVAGFVLGDGRSVVARLPRAEAEMLSLPALYREAGTGPGGDESTLVLVKADGERIGARFIGFDAGTGLSLLEAAASVFDRGAETSAAPLVIGQRVRVVAPLPAAAAAAAEARPDPAPAASENPDGPVGDAGVLYMSLGEIDGRLKEVRRTPTGRAAAFTIEVERASPEWAGGVVLSDAGALVGIVEGSGGRESRLLSAEAVRAAAARVQSRRASVPQPWLGARGDSVADSNQKFLLAQGWPREQAGELMRRQKGVVLTAVAPNSPAARAGLRPGDVIERIENHEVRDVEDMSWILREVGGNRRAGFSILRARNSPMLLRVELSESQNPAFETAHAEARAAETELRRADLLMRRLNESIRQVDENLRALDETIVQTSLAVRGGDKAALARHEQAVSQVAALRRQVDENRVRLRDATANLMLLTTRLGEAAARLSAAGTGRTGPAAQPLFPYGAEAMYFVGTNTSEGATISFDGLMVYSVIPGSAADQSGLRSGDLVETIEGRPSFEWRKSTGPASPEVTLGVLREGKKQTLKLKRPVR